ncbi:phosphatase PAP2 family protein [Halogeometricum limi]|uniref:PAP2 superfamily protein n=1 Tax=Halogeometricum limi TaxID=555875 RepID=A0A1I6FVE9_9EURY|nr:phosphatase PAP2 family protein [Halogeometricum limi]SFR33909.1 PAP2 superfamily protein [Halogeometricum limi]
MSLSHPAAVAPSPLVAPGGVPVASRGVGELLVAESLPDAAVSLFSLLTHLGDPWLCLFAISFAYVVGDRVGIARPSAAFVLALGLGAVGLTVGLKELFALPRPPMAAESGYGFPSGHALGTTVFWGGAALLLDVGRRRVRLGVAAAVVVLVALSRVVIRVHYLVDVVAGVAVGVLFLAAVFAVGPGLRRPSTPSDTAVVACFLLGGVLTSAAGVLDPIEREVLLGVGTAVAGAVTWSTLADAVHGARTGVSRRRLALGVVAFPAPLALMLVVAKLSPASLVVVAAGAVGGATLLGLPAAVSSLAD